MAAKKIIVITAPSGAGKTSITHYLLDRIPQLAFSTSASTRKPRSNEKNGVDYYFLSVKEFKKKIQNNEFIEWEMVYEGLYYGTLKSEIERLWKMGKIPLLDIDVIGAIHLKEQYQGEYLSIFIDTPSMDELKRRLESRGTETQESLKIRLGKATYELSFKHKFDKLILNDNLEKACKKAEQIVKNFIQQ